MKKLSVLLFAVCLSLLGFAQKNAIIPEPVSARFTDDNYLNVAQISYHCPAGQEGLIRNFVRELNWLGITLPEPEKGTRKSANLVLERVKTLTGEETYRMSISGRSIQIQASSDAGFFYGLQSLAQLSVADPQMSGMKIPCCSLEDQPRFGWRGLMLDESRHFFGKEKVKQLLDWMAFYKLNRFHWHLTDSHGWRLEILKYPQLTSVGGIGNFSDPGAAAAFYTQEEVREIIRYAAERFIEVIPEIDMPGHAAAANRAYPEFSGGGSANYPEFTFNPGKEETYSYLTDILREVALLFPSKYIHLGGDEVHFGNQQWTANRDVKALMEKHQLADLQAVEFYFIKRMTDSVAALDKTMIGWDEIVTAGIPAAKCKTMWWRHDKPQQLNRALEQGYHTILCPRIPLYFDFVQHNSHQSGRYWSKEYAPLEKILEFQKTYSGPLSSYPQLIDGIQANLWTETIDSAERLDFMSYPRIAALAEVAWSKNPSPSYSGFMQRLQPSFRLYKAKKISFFDPEHPGETPEIAGFKK